MSEPVPTPSDTAGIHPQLRHLAVDIATLAPDPRNARLHDERNIREVMRSYEAHGQRKTIVVQRRADDGTEMVVRAGNGQVEAARRLGWTRIAAVIVDENDRDAIAFALRDNRTAELAEWDYQVLATEAAQFEHHGGSLTEFGWTEAELVPMRETTWFNDAKGELEEHQRSKQPDNDASPDDEPDDEAPTFSKPGEVYELGRHRLYVGDSRFTALNVANIKMFTALFAGVGDPHVMIFDPPFDVPYNHWTVPHGVDVVAVWGYTKDTVTWMGHTFNDDAWSMLSYAFHGAIRSGFNPTGPCSLHANMFLMRRRWWGDDTEAALNKALLQKSTGLKLTSDGRPHSWHEVGPKFEDMPWSKPVSHYELVLAHAKPGSVVWDPCAGSGSSLLAAEKHGFTWRGAELAPKWADMVRRRWTKYARENGLEPGSGALE
jgi:hypothetical protein